MVTHLYSAGAKLSHGSSATEIFLCFFRSLSFDQLNAATENSPHTIHKFSVVCQGRLFKLHLYASAPESHIEARGNVVG